MEGYRRRPGEEWVDWQIRTFRGGLQRAADYGHDSADKRIIAAKYAYAGHLARATRTNVDVMSLIAWRNLRWWRTNKRKCNARRIRHRRQGAQRRWEQNIDDDWDAMGRDWMERARHRSRFREAAPHFVFEHQTMGSEANASADPDHWRQ